METGTKSNEFIKLVPINIDGEVLDNRQIFNFQNQMDPYENDTKTNVISDGVLLDSNMNMNDSDENTKPEKKPKKVLKLNIKKENSINKLTTVKTSQIKKNKKQSALNMPSEEIIKNFQNEQNYQNAFSGFVTNGEDPSSDFNSSKSQLLF